MNYQLTSDILTDYNDLTVVHTNQDGEVSTNTSPTVLNKTVFTVNGVGFSIPYVIVQSINIDGDIFSGTYDLESTNTIVADFSSWANSNGYTGATLSYSETDSIMTITIENLAEDVSSITLTAAVSNTTRVYTNSLTPYILYTSLESGLHTFKIIDSDTTTRIEEKCTFIDLEDKCILSKEQLLDYYLLKEADNCGCKCSDLRKIWECLQMEINNNCDDC